MKKFSRRDIIGGSVVLVTAIAGCSSSQSNDGPNHSTSTTSTETTRNTPTVPGNPKEVVREFYQAISSENVERARSYIHPDSDMKDYSEETFSDDFEIESDFKLVNQSQTTAKLKATFNDDAPEDPRWCEDVDDSNVVCQRRSDYEPETKTVELRLTNEEELKIWSAPV